MSDTKKVSGFAAMTPERRKEIARMGAAAVSARGSRYRFTPEKAREAAYKLAGLRRAVQPTQAQAAV